MISYRIKLIIIISLLVGVSQLLTGFIISKQSEKAMDEMHHYVAEAMARNLSNLSTRSFLNRDLASLYEQIKLAMQEKNILYVKVVDLENKILMSETLSEVGSAYAFPVVDKDNSGISHYTTSTKETVANVTEPIMLGKEILGHVVIGYSHAEISATLTQLKKKTLTTLLLGLTGAFLITVLIAAMITEPLLKLENIALKIAAGKFDLTKPNGRTHDAFNVLAQSMYNMAKRLELLVYNDPLTGIYNRLLLNIRLREELARSRRHEWPLAMLVVDIDHFKKINDTYGHLVGDEMLIGCSRILSDHIREEDCLARFGGEEFVILAPSMTGENAQQLAERIRAGMENEKFITRAGGTTIRMTISIGISIYPDHAGNENELMSQADKALYKAKAQGRNRVCLFSPPSSSTTEISLA